MYAIAIQSNQHLCLSIKAVYLRLILLPFQRVNCSLHLESSKVPPNRNVNLQGLV